MEERVLLILFGVVWALVVVATVWRYGEVPPVEWAVLPTGIGAIRVAFRPDRPSTTPPKHSRQEGE